MPEYLSTIVAAPMSFATAIMMQPLWLQAWVGWMMLVNLVGAVVFIRKPEAKWVLAAIVPAALLMIWLYDQFGYQRILGLAHVAFWTPLMIYLWSRRKRWDLPTLPGKWLAAVFVTDLTSLVIDYIDVVRYLAGERL